MLNADCLRRHPLGALACFQVLQNLGPEMRDVAGAQRQDHVACGCGGGGFAGSIFEGGDVAGFLASYPADRVGNALATHSGDRRFAGRVDIEDKNGVSIGKSPAEFLDQVSGTAVAVGLKDYVDTVE